MKEPEETHDEQTWRVLKEMVESGQITYEERDGEIYFKLTEETYDRNN